MIQQMIELMFRLCFVLFCSTEYVLELVEDRLAFHDEALLCDSSNSRTITRSCTYGVCM